MRDNHELRGRSRAAATVAAGLVALSGAFELGNARASAAESQGRENPVMVRTDNQLKMVVREMKSLYKQHAKGVSVKKMDTGSEYIASVPIKDTTGQVHGYDTYVAMVSGEPLFPSKADVPYMSMMIAGADKPGFNLKGNYSDAQVTIVERDFFPKEKYIWKTYDQGSPTATEILPAGSSPNQTQMNQLLADFTSNVDGLIESIDPPSGITA